MSPQPVLVVGNAVLDILLGVDQVPQEDEEMRALSRRMDLGGNAANTARVLAGLGHPVSLLAVLAPDAEAGALRKLLEQARVDPRFLVTAASGHTPVSHILVHQANGSRTIVHHRDLPELHVAHFRALPLQDYGWIHFEGRNVDEVTRMMKHLGKSGFSGRISLELEKDRPGLEALAPHADLVLSCRAYARARGYADAPALLAALHGLCPRAILTCTWGEAGAWALADEGGLTHSPAFVPARVVDTVGAGDVFNAGVIHGLATGNSVALALADATRLAGRKVAQSGFSALT